MMEINVGLLVLIVISIVLIKSNKQKNFFYNKKKQKKKKKHTMIEIIETLVVPQVVEPTRIGSNTPNLNMKQNPKRKITTLNKIDWSEDMWLG